MKKSLCAIGLIVSLSLVSASAQFGGRPGGMGGPPGPQFDGAMAKLFGDNPAFTATLEIQAQNMTMPGRFAFDQDKSRFEVDMSNIKGAQLPPDAAAQLKGMGMDKMVTITLPAEKTLYLIYPGMKAYAPMSVPDQDSAKASSDFKVEMTELGKDTVDGHPCVKNKAVVTNDKGEKHEFTVWNATDLKKFPVKLEMNEKGQAMTLYFKDVKLSKPDSTEFELPADYKKYDSMQSMMQGEIMKRIGGMSRPPK